MWFFCFLVVGQLVLCLRAAFLPPQIPSIQSFYPDDSGRAFILSPETEILVDKTHAFHRDSRPNGPTLLDFARTFRSDLVHLTSFMLPEVQVTLLSPARFINGGSAIVLTVNSSNSHTLYSGIPTTEAYDFHISNSSYVISGSGSVGAWWGTRTFLQQLVLSEQGPNGAYIIPAGSGTDSPGWEVRGFALDAGRHWYTTEFLGKWFFVNNERR